MVEMYLVALASCYQWLLIECKGFWSEKEGQSVEGFCYFFTFLGDVVAKECKDI